MLFCGTCGIMVRTETNTCPKCSSVLTPAFVSREAKANSTSARKQSGNGAKKLLIGGIVLSLVAVASAVAFHVVMRPGRSVYLLPDGNVMAYINFTPMHFMKMDTSPLTAVPEYQRFVNEIGVRPDRDLENIAISAHADGQSGDVAIIVTGTFDPQRLTGYVLKQEGVQTETYARKTIFSLPERAQTTRFCVLNSKMVALTVGPTADSMHAIIDKSAGSGSVPYLFEHYYDYVPSASAMWAIVRVPSYAVTDSAAVRGPNLNFLKNSVTIVSVRYTGSLRFRGEFIAENQADATNIFQAVNGILAMGRLGGGPRQNDPDVTAVMNSLEVKQNGNHVVLSFVVPQNVIQKAALKY